MATTTVIKIESDNPQYGAIGVAVHSLAAIDLDSENSGIRILLLNYDTDHFLKFDKAANAWAAHSKAMAEWKDALAASAGQNL